MNKKKLKETIQNDFNKEKNLNKIVEKIEAPQLRTMKYALIPVCVLILITVFALSPKLNHIDSMIFDNNSEIYINKIKANGINSLDADIKILDGKLDDIDCDFVQNLKIPSGFIVKDVYSVYTRSDLTKKEYDTFNNYVIDYELNEKSITIAFSDKYKPLRDIFYESSTNKTSTIYNVKVNIYGINTSYYAIFTYKNINFDIETNNITKSELIALINSIVEGK